MAATETQTESKPNSAALIETRQVSKSYRDFGALTDCSLVINEGEVFGLLGPNGAGKSTLIRLLLGFLKPSSGQSTIQGLDCWSQRELVHRLVAYIPGDARLFRMMTGKGILRLFSQLRHPDRAVQQQLLANGLELADFLELDLKRWVGLMSTGMRQKLALVTCFMADTPIMILDEPTANLDPTVRGRVLELVERAKSIGSTIVFSSHVLSEIEDVCDRVAILRSGQLVHTAPMSEIRLKHRIRARIIGDLPPIPTALQPMLEIRQSKEQIQIDTPGELSEVLKWLAEASLAGMHVQPIGLKSIYDYYHSNQSDSSHIDSSISLDRAPSRQ